VNNSSIPLYVCWTIDWQDNYLWESKTFIDVSNHLIACANDFLGNTATWLIEVDDLTDITRHEGVTSLIAKIEASGGEVGIHIHHTSVDLPTRGEHYRRAINKVKQAGGTPSTYSAGMGNYINEDTQILADLGIQSQRFYTGNYVNATLPPLEWFPPSRKMDVFPTATHQAVANPTQNPVACDWRGTQDRAGYLDPQDYHRVLDMGPLFGVPLGIMGGNEDGEHQLHLQPRIPLQRLIAIFNGYITRAQRGAVLVACYFHPYDLTERELRLSDKMVERWKKFVRYQRQSGCRFITLTEAKNVYDQLRVEGLTLG
jgi:hypothetical protein